jgi:hypothetical protein
MLNELLNKIGDENKEITNIEDQIEDIYNDEHRPMSHKD